MPRLQSTSNAVLVGAVAVVLVACAPRSTRLSASGAAPARCNGVAVLDVQNDLGASIQIFEMPASTSRKPVTSTLLGPGWHTLKIDATDNHRYFARTVGESPFASYSIGPSDSRVRIAVRCQATG